MIYAHVKVEKLINFTFGFDAVYHGVGSSGYYRRLVRHHLREAKEKSRTVSFQCFFKDNSDLLTKCFVNGDVLMINGITEDILIPAYQDDNLEFYPQPHNVEE